MQLAAQLQGPNMGDLLIAAIARGGDRIAFVDADRRTTYRALGEQVSGLIQALSAQGLKKGDVIATLSPNRPEAFMMTAAGYLMGLQVVWMNPMSSEADHQYQIDDAGVQILFVDPGAFGTRALAIQQQCAQSLNLFGLGPWAGQIDILAQAATYQPQRLQPQASENDPCVLIYTGGTTGKPKGVVHTHRVHVAMTLMEMADFDWPEEIRFLAMTPITHASGALIMPVLMQSGTFIMHAGFDPGIFCELVERHRVTCSFMVPTMIYVLLDSVARKKHDLNSLQTIIYGAAPMSVARLREAIDVFGPIFMQLYGQSEAPMAMTVLHKREHDPKNYPHRLSSCGTPVVGIQLKLLNDQGVEVPIGEVGEICVRGPLVMVGYRNKPDETAQAFRHGWLYSGDLARRDQDGFIYIVDRSKDMIISGGFNVYPREIEDVLGSHPAVGAVAVIGIPDPKWGESVQAMVVLRDPTTSALETVENELAALVRSQKGSVHVPKKIHFVDRLLTTGLGKIDKKAMRLALSASLSASLSAPLSA